MLILKHWPGQFHIWELTQECMSIDKIRYTLFWPLTNVNNSTCQCTTIITTSQVLSPSDIGTIIGASPTLLKSICE